MTPVPPVFPAPEAGGTDRPPALFDRALGAFLGLAVGDALGTPLEFSMRDSLPHQTRITGGGPFGLAPGQWTDDTAMALALAESLVRRGGLDPSDLMGRFVAWWRFGAYSCTGACFDIGTQTAEALARFEKSHEPFAGTTHEHAAGNGSLMRMAPAVLFALDDRAETTRIAREQSRTTHGAPQALDACALFAEILAEAILGEREPLRPRAFAGHPAIATIASGAWREKSRDEIRSSGYVVDTLEAALWAVGRTENFEDALILAVNLGDDSDTVGAVTGQMARALHGAAAIPESWRAQLAWRDTFTAATAALLQGSRP